MGYDDDAPRLSEIGRMIGSIDRKMDDFRQEVRTALADKVSKETYQAERDAMRERIAFLERSNIELRSTIENDSKARAKSITNVIYGSVGTLIVGLISAFLMTRGT